MREIRLSKLKDTQQTKERDARRRTISDSFGKLTRMNLHGAKEIQAGKASADVASRSITDTFQKRLEQIAANVLSPKDAASIPYSIDLRVQNLEKIAKRFEEFHATEAGVSPILATLPVIAGQRQIPSGERYDGLRALQRNVQDAGFLRVYCPGNPRIESELNARLTPQRDLMTTLALYMHHYDNVSDWKELLIGPTIGAAVGTGIAYGVQVVPELVAHVPHAVLSETGKTILNGVGVGTVYTAGDIVDNGAAFVSQAASDVRNGIPLNQVARKYGSNAVNGAIAGEFFNLGGGEIYTHGGLAGHLAGAAVISIMTSLGIAAEAKENQDTNTEAYRQLLAERRILPSDKILALQRRIEDASGSERRELGQQIDKVVDTYARKLGLLETTASLPNRRANYALLLTPAYALIPDPSVQAGALGGSENFNLGGINMLALAAARMGLGYEQRMVRKVAAGKGIDFMRLAGTPLAISAQNVAYTLGRIGKAPEKIRLLKNRGGEKEAPIQ